jgi:hypothetical protein
MEKSDELQKRRVNIAVNSRRLFVGRGMKMLKTRCVKVQVEVFFPKKPVEH